eukprot:3754279-Alexandrium_andersonii.AAC.1
MAQLVLERPCGEADLGWHMGASRRAAAARRGLRRRTHRPTAEADLERFGLGGPGGPRVRLGRDDGRAASLM